MPQLDSDSFTYSDGALATVSGGKWTDCTIGGSVRVVSNQINNAGNENAAVITSWAGSTTTQWAEVLYVSGSFGGPTIFNDGASTFYLCELTAASAVVLYRVVGGSFNAIGIGINTVAGHTYRIRCQTAGTIIISDNGTDIITAALETAITSGKPGIRSWSDTIDDWAAGDFATTAIKTRNALAKASVKTFNGLASASTKTVNGLA